ncbi:MAG: hypothetical protein JWP57_566 [Spirosoma sp.]|nr:hypothetical protein [Spirosoma sp.]
MEQVIKSNYNALTLSDLWALYQYVLIQKQQKPTEEKWYNLKCEIEKAINTRIHKFSCLA